jgi:hypothetical protein
LKTARAKYTPYVVYFEPDPQLGRLALEYIHG